MKLVVSSDVTRTIFGEKASSTLLSPTDIVEKNEPLEFLSPRRLLEARGFSFTSRKFYDSDRLDLD